MEIIRKHIKQNITKNQIKISLDKNQFKKRLCTCI